MEDLKAPDRRDGHTLIESVIVLLLLTVVLGGIATVVLRSQVFSGEFTRRSVIDQTGWRIMDRIGEELRGAMPTTVMPALLAASDYVEFQQVAGFVSGAPQLSNTFVLGFQLAPGESVNGQDDNGDGRADEGFVSYLDRGSTPPGSTGIPPGFSGTAVEQTGPKPIPLAGHVLGVRFDSTTNGIAFSVDIGLVDRQGNLMQKTFTEEISFRN